MRSKSPTAPSVWTCRIRAFSSVISRVACSAPIASRVTRASAAPDGDFQQRSPGGVFESNAQALARSQTEARQIPRLGADHRAWAPQKAVEQVADARLLERLEYLAGLQDRGLIAGFSIEPAVMTESCAKHTGAGFDIDDCDPDPKLELTERRIDGRCPGE